MKPLILIPQSNTPTQIQTMISTFRVIVVKCDRCGKMLVTNASTEQMAKDTAERNGWLIADKGNWLSERHYCPDCL